MTKIGANFENWLKTASTSLREKDLRNKSFKVLGSAWDNLVTSGASAEKLDNAYRNAFVNLGKSYIKHLDKKYGDGDGKLTTEEYLKSELKALPLAERNAPDVIQAAKNLVTNININGDKIIDIKEMTAVLSLFDKDVKNGNLNGRINGYDYTACAMSLVEDKNNKNGAMIRQRLTNRYNQLFGTNVKHK